MSRQTSRHTTKSEEPHGQKPAESIHVRPSGNESTADVSSVVQARRDPRGLSPHQIVALQRSVGNAAVQRLIQPKQPANVHAPAADPAAGSAEAARALPLGQRHDEEIQTKRSLQREGEVGMGGHETQAESPIQRAATSSAVIQQTNVGQHTIQRGFWGDLWGGIKKVGKAVGGAIASGAQWVGERVRDASMWVVNLIRDLPDRLMRLGQTLWDGLSGVISFIPEAIQALASGGLSGFGDWLWQKAKDGGTWVLTLLSRVFDTLGGPEILEFVMHMLSKATPLTGPEIAAASRVLGPSAIRYGEVRIAEGGLLDLIFKLNKGRAFTTWHTINIPSTGDHARSNLAIMVHELTHVYQYERAGSLYLGQAIHAQMTIGYGYGGAAGLSADRAAGKHYRTYNREQQAQIAQDYYTLVTSGGDTTAYQPFITELQAGDL